MTTDTFAAEVLEADKPVLVDFWATWCPPCRAMSPLLADMAAERDDLKIVSVDVDNEQELAVKYGVLGMPTFMLFDNGNQIANLVGARPRKRLESELREALMQQPAGR
ncbi:thioredoxin [Solirubrobacter phytolaccae]|uniref:Thioredoxin n=1 Tax=Solirubrobacter phytolaccae TaxID=1404360 RepID=A0A9X3NJC0_9ACTN|nr:thioredoxin [Solirubrobacter phytolaccae]MDA0184631.1 thioredoxin [Solirubrobacter phytolaccae]